MFKFCKTRWARRKKPERKSRNWIDQNTKNQKTKIWDERNVRLVIQIKLLQFLISWIKYINMGFISMKPVKMKINQIYSILFLFCLSLNFNSKRNLVIICNGHWPCKLHLACFGQKIPFPYNLNSGLFIIVKGWDSISRPADWKIVYWSFSFTYAYIAFT